MAGYQAFSPTNEERKKKMVQRLVVAHALGALLGNGQKGGPAGGRPVVGGPAMAAGASATAGPVQKQPPMAASATAAAPISDAERARLGKYGDPLEVLARRLARKKAGLDLSVVHDDSEIADARQRGYLPAITRQAQRRKRAGLGAAGGSG
jgi:hypothetical protein